MENFLADQLIPDAESRRPRKQMRKGTRSCVECRRRKTRCNFPPGASVCVQCSGRGSKCIDQRDDVGRATPRGLPTTPSVSPKQTEIEHHSSTATELHAADIGVPSGPRPPLVSVLDHGEDQDGYSMAASPDAGATQANHTVLQRARVCSALRSALPSYDKIIAVLAKNGAWWESFRQKTRVISQAEPAEPLLSFAAHAYTSTNPAELAILAVSYARSLGRRNAVFAIVDSLVISDFSLAVTVAGMECLILLAKSYTDIGQPRRAWLMWRKGLAIAQLMGLHRVRLETPDIRQRIWLAIYHGDRFTSLLLGLPHGFNDTSFELPTSKSSPSFETWLPQFIHECAVVAGQVIDSIMTPVKPSFAKAMSIDEQLDAMFNLTPTGWWDIPTEISGRHVEISHEVDKLLIQLFFFHVRMYAHLPFLNSSVSSSSRNVSKLACTDAARNLLRRYLVLRTEVDGVSLFDCKTSDFVGFTAAVALLIGFSNVQGNMDVPQSEDLQLVAGATRTFQRLEEKDECPIAAQCRKALVLLSCENRGETSQQHVVIPHFGKVVRRNGVKSTQAGDSRDAEPVPPLTPSDATPAFAPDSESSWSSEYFIDYLGYPVQDFPMDALWGEGQAVDENAVFSLGLDTVSMDIDQDWGLFASLHNG